MLPTDDRDHLDVLCAKQLGHFDGDAAAPATRDHQGGIGRSQIEVPQNSISQPGAVLDEHCLSLAIAADHRMVERHGQFDQRIESGKGAITRPHFLDQNAAVSGAEHVDHAARQNRLSEPVGRLLDLGELSFDLRQQLGTA